MITYTNQGVSGVIAYQFGMDYIDVQFKGGTTYRYNYEQTGSQTVKRMKILATQGQGLSTFISRKVRDNHASKVR